MTEESGLPGGLPVNPVGAQGTASRDRLHQPLSSNDPERVIEKENETPILGPVVRIQRPKRADLSTT